MQSFATPADESQVSGHQRKVSDFGLAFGGDWVYWPPAFARGFATALRRRRRWAWHGSMPVWAANAMAATKASAIDAKYINTAGIDVAMLMVHKIILRIARTQRIMTTIRVTIPANTEATHDHRIEPNSLP